MRHAVFRANNSRSSSRATIAERVRTPSFSKMRRTCVETVIGLISHQVNSPAEDAANSSNPAISYGTVEK